MVPAINQNHQGDANVSVNGFAFNCVIESGADANVTEENVFKSVIDAT